MKKKFKLDTGWDIPTGLTRQGRAIAFAIRQIAYDRHWHSGGQKVFWSPREWDDRGEQYRSDILNLLYEGGDHAPSFSLDYASEGGSYINWEEMLKLLEEHGVHHEQYFRWAGGLYS